MKTFLPRRETNSTNLLKSFRFPNFQQFRHAHFQNFSRRSELNWLFLCILFRRVLTSSSFSKTFPRAHCEMIHDLSSELATYQIVYDLFTF